MSHLASRFAIARLNYEATAQLGVGSFARVSRAVNKNTGEPVAIKFYSNALLPEQQSWFLREMEILAMNYHPATLRLIGFSFLPIDGNPGPVVITPFMPGDTIGTLLRQERQGKSPPDWNATAKTKCVFGIAAGMASLHSREVMHRDLKPDNIFLNENWEPVIGDFGLAKCCLGDISRTMGAVGSPLYIAPEIFADDDDIPADGPAYDLSVDVYSFAVLLCMMFSREERPTLDGGKQPRSAQMLMMAVRRGTRLQRPPGIPDCYWATIERCWTQEPARRPSFAELVAEFQTKHEYVLEGADMKEVIRYEEYITSRGQKRAKS
jgi:serine/threonine-protein kinase CTR1